MSNSIKCLRLENGDVVIGKVKESFFKYTVEEAHACIVTVEGEQMEVGLAPWVPYAKDFTFDISKVRVVTCFEPRPNLATNYKVLTGNK
jgi:hypothetical protein